MMTVKPMYMDKSSYGPGPWQNEPDFLLWKDEETGFWCMIKRPPNTGSLCGYVGVPPNNPNYFKNYEDLGLDVHGGTTFSGTWTGDKYPKEDLWWFGFDCAHAGDICPVFRKTMQDFGIPSLEEFGDTYKDINYVKQEVESLARQLRTADNEGQS